VVAEILGVVKLKVPVPLGRGDPPVAAAYQSMVSPALTLADIITVPGPHLEPSTGPVGGLGVCPFTTAPNIKRKTKEKEAVFLTRENMDLVISIPIPDNDNACTKYFSIRVPDWGKTFKKYLRISTE
jgi:hypothetical protein